MFGIKIAIFNFFLLTQGNAMVVSAHPTQVALHQPLLTTQLVPERCDLESFEQAVPIEQLFAGRPIQIIGDTSDGAVSRRLSYFFTLDPHLQKLIENAFVTHALSELDIHVVSQQELYQVQAEAQNIFDPSTQKATIQLASNYVIGDYDNPCALSSAGVENEFSEILLRAQFYATYGRELQHSVFQESATFAVSSLVNLLIQGESFESAEEVRIILQDVLTIAQRSYTQNTNLVTSSSEVDSAFIASWLNDRLSHLLPTTFADGRVEFVIDTSAGRGNVIRPIVVAE